jgi:hypothetical protein
VFEIPLSYVDHLIHPTNCKFSQLASSMNVSIHFVVDPFQPRLLILIYLAARPLSHTLRRLEIVGAGC